MRATAPSHVFHPEHALILNIEEEHLDFYADLAAIEKVFAQLIAQTSGKVFLQCRRSERNALMSIVSHVSFLRFFRSG